MSEIKSKNAKEYADYADEKREGSERKKVPSQNYLLSENNGIKKRGR